MKYAEINKKFTEAIAGYITEGYTFNTATMGGSQGERARVDLTNGTEIVTIYLTQFAEWGDGCSLKGWELVVAHPNEQDELIPNDRSDCRILWLSHVETISVERFYQLGHDDDWFMTREEAIIAVKKSYERFNNKPRTYGTRTTELTSPKALQLAKQYLINRRVGKRIDMSQLKVKKRIEKPRVQFYIVYKGQYYWLH